MTEKDNGEDGEETKTTSSRLWTPYGDPREYGYREDAGEQRRAVDGPPGGEEGEELSEEEMRRRIEEALERITVTDVIVEMMISLSSLAYQKMGIPPEVNAKYKDLEQARLAIDCLDALTGQLEGALSEEQLKPLAGTVDNLKLNYARES